ncbi:MAG: AAA family ATPase [Legionellaceae bacterium]|nr:AAA family ATPase [Legionellaceae bacterium]
MPLQLLSVPSDSNPFFSAFSLSLLLPIINQDEQFDQAVERLFGPISRRASSVLIQELENYSVNTFPDSLNKLINTQLRPKIVAYIMQHQSEYIDLVSSSQDFAQRVESINHPNTSVDALEINVMSAIVDVDVRIHQTFVIPEQIPHSNTSSRSMLHLLCINGVYQYFINPDSLSESMRQRLFPVIHTQNVILPERVDLGMFQRAKSKQLLENMLMEVPTHIKNISRHVAARPEYDELMAPNPADAKFALRIDAQHELKTIRTSMEQVRLTLGYDLCLMTQDGCQLKRMLYITIAPNEFSYTIQGEVGNLHTGIIEYQALDHVFTLPVTIEQLRLCLPKILKITGKSEHTLIKPVEIGSFMRSWTPSMLKSGGVGMVSGAAAIGVVTMIGEFGIAAGVGISAIPYAGLPVGLCILFITISVAGYGKNSAIKYEGALEEANKLLSEGRFHEAAQILDVEFNRWRITLRTRDLFLTSEHHAMAHYFRAICAEQLNTNNDDAYIHYQKACKAALRVKKSFALFISKLQLLRLLKNSPSEQLPVLINREQEINNIIEELTKNFTNGFTELYWSVLDKLTVMANRFRTFEPLSAGEIKSANTFLLVQDFYILKYYGDGFGVFIEIVSTFFQGAILGVFGHMNTAYLDERVQKDLVCELLDREEPAPRGLENDLASMKFEQTAKLLRIFKQENESVILKHRTLSSTIEFIETFILKFHAASINGESITVEQYFNLARILNTRPQIAESNLEATHSSIQFLATIQEDFGLFFELEERWLDALLANPSQVANLVSEKTGDTMLHVLIKFKPKGDEMIKRVQAAALYLKELRYERNHDHETPISMLQSADPHQLTGKLYSGPLVRVGDELAKIERFLKRIENHPEVEGHVLLLDGPSGTGKSSSVLKHVRSLGYQIHPWTIDTSSRSKNAPSQIKAFFQSVKSQEKSNHPQVIFINQIEAVIPKDSNTDSYQLIKVVQAEITALRQQQVVLIGTTDRLDKLDKSIKDMAGANRIHFTLPNATQRQQLLKHFFRFKKISPSDIEQLARVSVCYSIQQLRSFVDTIELSLITLDILMELFNAYARTLSQNFNDELSCAKLFMPSFTSEEVLHSPSTINNSVLADQCLRLQNQTTTSHQPILLYGPMECDKTAAARKIAQASGRIFIWVQAGKYTSIESLTELMDKALTLGRVVLFFDNMERIGSTDTPLITVLQTILERYVSSDILFVGATQTKEQLDPGILRNFTTQIELLKPTPVELTQVIKRSLVGCIKTDSTLLHVDDDLIDAVVDGAMELGNACDGLAMHRIQAIILDYINELQEEKPNEASIIQLRLQDVLFYIANMKSQVKNPSGNTPFRSYIQKNKQTIFLQDRPLSTCNLLLRSAIPNQSDLLALSLLANTTYIRVSSDITNTLLFIEHSTESYIEIPINQNQQTQFDIKLQPLENARALSKQDRRNITTITRHSIIKTCFAIDILVTLQNDFSLSFPTVEAWLDALSSQSTIRNAVSGVTGDTMLHLLVQFISANEHVVAQVKEITSNLQTLRYSRNLQQETPLFVLQKQDPHQLKQILCSEPMVKLGDELMEVDEFIRSVQSEPIKNKRFLLLEGPPGTGKSETVLLHLQEQGHRVYQWDMGESGDKWVGGLQTRIREFFNKAKDGAKSEPDKFHFLFIDEINGVCPHLEGTAKNGQHNQQNIVETFQTQVDELKRKGNPVLNVALVGTTNFPELIAKAMLTRATRVRFLLPNALGREKLLQHFFIEKCITDMDMKRIADLTTGWSPRGLLSIATSIKENIVNEHMLESACIKSAEESEADFRQSFPHAQLTLPAFKETHCEDPLVSLSVVDNELRQQFKTLAESIQHPDLYKGIRMHALLHGPAGGGKTTAIRTFSRAMNYAFILIEAGVSANEMYRIFDRAKAFNPAIIFIDEIDQVAFDGSPCRELLQEQMDGFLKNNIVVVGATNFPERLPRPILDRFILNIYAPEFNIEQRGKLFVSMLQEQLLNDSTIQMDEALHAELQMGCPTLSQMSHGLSLRALKSRIVILFGGIRVEGSKKPTSIMQVTLVELLKVFGLMEVPNPKYGTSIFQDTPTNVTSTNQHTSSSTASGDVPIMDTPLSENTSSSVSLF